MSLVESVVAPVLTGVSGAGASRAQDTGQGYDFAIGGLMFNVASDDQNPYQRATAQFKKDQLDTTPTPGDQSLVGYWTRGQFSFHNGAGVTYYEVEGATSIYTLRSDTVIERFRDGIGVVPFTPGQVTCARAFSADTANTYGAVTWVGSTATQYAVLDNGVVRRRNIGTATFTNDTPSTGTVVAACAGPTNVYVATTANKIEVSGGAALYTHSATIKGLWYAKDRLLMVDDTNAWYQLTPNPTGTLPVATASTDKVFTTSAVYAHWSLTEAPGPVLISDGASVYAVVPDSSTGSMPTLSAPVVVAQLPRGEHVTALKFYLGYLIIATTKGVRVAVVDNSGTVNYGPLLFTIPTLSAGPVQITARDSSVYVPLATGDSTAGIYEVNLSQNVGQNTSSLEFAYCRVGDPLGASAVGGVYGVGIWGNDMVPYHNTVLLVESQNLTSGTLTTGFHRYATLEPKQFRSVKVRVAGNGGTVQVSRVMADDSTVNLFTIDVSQSSGEVITLGLNTTVEMVGLRFTLTPSGADATVGPTLLGYQLYALPAPQRQRMIQVPLLCFDVEARQPARRVGHRGAAWERLAALEDMERSGGTFVFQDFRTGEAGECFIEAVEFKGTTPPTAASTGFGGIVNLTVRKL